MVVMAMLALTVYAIFAPQNLPKVEAAFKEELARALKDGYTTQELAEGKIDIDAVGRMWNLPA